MSEDSDIIFARNPNCNVHFSTILLSFPGRRVFQDLSGCTVHFASDSIVTDILETTVTNSMPGNIVFEVGSVQAEEIELHHLGDTQLLTGVFEVENRVSILDDLHGCGNVFSNNITFMGNTVPECNGFGNTTFNILGTTVSLHSVDGSSNNGTACLIESDLLLLAGNVSTRS